MRRKVYALLTLLLSVVGFANADETTAVQITALDQLSNNKCYTVQAYDTARGGWYVNPEDMATLYSTGKAGIEMDATSQTQAFAILKSETGNYYFYSVSGKKFMIGNGDGYVNLTDEPQSSNNKLISSSSSKISAGYPWVAADGDNQFNMSQDQYTGVLSNWNDIDDGGNAIKITEVGDFDPTEALTAIKSYETNICKVTVHYIYKIGEETVKTEDVETYVNKGTEYNFKSVPTFFGVRTLTELPASATINEDTEVTRTMEYEEDYEKLPFIPTSIVDGKFADGTHWYYMTIRTEGRYIYSLIDGDYAGYMGQKVSSSRPAETNAFFAFSGNPICGYNIHTYADGPSKSIYAKEEDRSYPTMEENGVPFYLEQLTEETYLFNISTDDDRSAYLNDYSATSEYLSVYDWYDYGRSDAGSAIRIMEVSAQELEFAVNGGLLKMVDTTPATGEVKGSLSHVSVLFDKEIGDIESSMTITVTDTQGNTVTTGKASINAENKALLDIELEKTLTELGTYTINIPANMILGVGDERSQELNISYTLIEEFSEYTVTGRIHKYDPWLGSKPVWSLYQFPGLQEEEYLTCKVNVIAKNKIKLIGYTGVEDDEVTLVFNPETEKLVSIDGQGPDSYNSAWVDTSVGDYYAGYGTYYGMYLYFDISTVNLAYEEGNGRAILKNYCYNTLQEEYIFIDWKDDDSYAELNNNTPTVPEVTGRVYNYDFTNYYNSPALSLIDFPNGQEYVECKVQLIDDSNIKIKGFVGNSHNVKLTYNPNTYYVSKINDEEGDAVYGSVWITTGIDDLGYDGIYAYPGYSYVVRSTEPNGFSYAMISVYTYTTTQYEYIYIGWMEDDSFGTGIKSVNSDTKQNGIYTLSGMPVQKIQQPGLYISNGKKIYVR